MKRACVIGWPIAQSRSPLIHGYWLKALGIEGSYEKVPVKPDDLPSFLRDFQVKGFTGCNVTMPHKESAFALVDETDAIAARLCAVNTIYLRNGRLFGTNTDGEGFVANLIAKCPDAGISGNTVAMLGAGGSAKAIAAALLDAGASRVIIINRALDRAENLRADLGERIGIGPWGALPDALREAGLLVNATSLGMRGQADLDVDFTPLQKGAIVVDIVYVPLETGFLRKAREAGYRTVGGLGMLLHQAVRGFELWFGQKPVVTPELEQLVAQDVLRA
jgi:shikimate dehydrogenase